MGLRCNNLICMFENATFYCLYNENIYLFAFVNLLFFSVTQSAY